MCMYTPLLELKLSMTFNFFFLLLGLLGCCYFCYMGNKCTFGIVVVFPMALTKEL